MELGIAGENDLVLLLLFSRPVHRQVKEVAFHGLAGKVEVEITIAGKEEAAAVVIHGVREEGLQDRVTRGLGVEGREVGRDVHVRVEDRAAVTEVENGVGGVNGNREVGVLLRLRVVALEEEPQVILVLNLELLRDLGHLLVIIRLAQHEPEGVRFQVEVGRVVGVGLRDHGEVNAGDLRDNWLERIGK